MVPVVATPPYSALLCRLNKIALHTWKFEIVLCSFGDNDCPLGKQLISVVVYMYASHLSRRQILFCILGATSVARLSTALHLYLCILSFSPSVTFRTQTSRWRELPAWKRTDLSTPPPPRPSPSHLRTCSVRSRSWPAQASLRGVSTMRTQHCGAPLSSPHSSFSLPAPSPPQHVPLPVQLFCSHLPLPPGATQTKPEISHTSVSCPHISR